MSAWYYTKDGKQKVGPVSTGQLRELARSGQLQPSDMVKRDDMPKWTQAAQVKGLFEGHGAAASPGLPDATPVSSGDRRATDPHTPSTFAAVFAKAKAIWDGWNWKIRAGVVGSAVVLLGLIGMACSGGSGSGQPGQDAASSGGSAVPMTRRQFVNAVMKFQNEMPLHTTEIKGRTYSSYSVLNDGVGWDIEEYVRQFGPINPVANPDDDPPKYQTGRLVKWSHSCTDGPVTIEAEIYKRELAEKEPRGLWVRRIGLFAGASGSESSGESASRSGGRYGWDGHKEVTPELVAKKLHKGMTPDEVVAALGKPGKEDTKNTDLGTFLSYTYQPDTDGWVVVSFQDGRLVGASSPKGNIIDPRP